MKPGVQAKKVKSKHHSLITKVNVSVVGWSLRKGFKSLDHLDYCSAIAALEFKLYKLKNISDKPCCKVLFVTRKINEQMDF